MFQIQDISSRCTALGPHFADGELSTCPKMARAQWGQAWRSSLSVKGSMPGDSQLGQT